MTKRYFKVKDEYAFQDIKGKKVEIIGAGENVVVVREVGSHDGGYKFGFNDLEPWVEPEPKKKSYSWIRMTDKKPPVDTTVIGMSDPFSPSVICGILYDMRDNSIIDMTTGRWMECSHWTMPPDR